MCGKNQFVLKNYVFVETVFYIFVLKELWKLKEIVKMLY